MNNLTKKPRTEAGTEASQLHGRETLESITVTNRATGASKDVAAHGVFVMIGADPCTGWLKGSVALDDKGFVRAGEGTDTPFATSHAGIFAVGDVRSGSVKRVASAVGSGRSKGAAASAALGTSTATPARNPTPRASSTATPSTRTCCRNGTGPRATWNSPKSSST